MSMLGLPCLLTRPDCPWDMAHANQPCATAVVHPALCSLCLAARYGPRRPSKVHTSAKRRSTLAGLYRGDPYETGMPSASACQDKHVEPATILTLRLYYVDAMQGDDSGTKATEQHSARDPAPGPVLGQRKQVA